MDNSGKPSLKDIMVALEQSGYLMEQEVATQLERLGFHVTTNRAFEDSEEGKSREIDVQAIKRVAFNEQKKLAGYIELIAECKNSSNPFVFVGRPKNTSDGKQASQEFVFPIAKYESRKDLGGGRAMGREKDAFFHLGFDKIHYDFTAKTKAVQFCRIDRKGASWHANHGGLYDSIFYPMAKAIFARKAEIPKNSRDDEWRYFWFFIPLVVVSGDIFYVDSELADPTPELRDFVTIKRELRSTKLNGRFAIDFVRQAKLETFVNNCLEPLVAGMTDLAMNQADRVLKRHIPWED